LEYNRKSALAANIFVAAIMNKAKNLNDSLLQIIPNNNKNAENSKGLKINKSTNMVVGKIISPI